MIFHHVRPHRDNMSFYCTAQTYAARSAGSVALSQSTAVCFATPPSNHKSGCSPQAARCSAPAVQVRVPRGCQMSGLPLRAHEPASSLWKRGTQVRALSYESPLAEMTLQKTP